MDNCHFCRNKLKITAIIFCQNRHQHYCHLKCAKQIFKSLFDQNLHYNINKLKCQEPGCNAFYVGMIRDNLLDDTLYKRGIKTAKQVINIYFFRNAYGPYSSDQRKLEMQERITHLFEIFK